MRACIFFENTVANEAEVYVNKWTEAVAMMAFQSQDLEPYALISGMPTLPIEASDVEFGTEEVSDIRRVFRILLDLPDIKSDDLLLVFAGSRVKELFTAPKDEKGEYVYEGNLLAYYQTANDLFESVREMFKAHAPDDVKYQSYTPVQGVEASRQYAMTALLRNAKVEDQSYQYVPNPDLVNQAVELELPLPPDFDLAAFRQHQAELLAAAQAAAPTDVIEPEEPIHNEPILQ